MARQITITFGPPGTGKTTDALNQVDGYLKQGIPPNRIAFVSYTKKAVSEAAERAAEKFGFNPNELTHFRTLHSTAYRSLGIRRNEMMDRADYKELGKLTGLKLGGYSDSSDGLLTGAEGDSMLQLISFANATYTELRDVWRLVENDVDWFRLKQLAEAHYQYKMDMDKIDFDDLFKQFMTERPLIDVDAVIIDEAQDLSNAQWNMAKIAFRQTRNIGIAGDDDQAIYGWSGANVERFLAIKGDVKVLNQSYRLSKAVYKIADGIIKNIRQRREKTWAPRSAEGSVNYINDVDHPNYKEGSWLLLARNAFFLNDYKQALTIAGVPYTFRGKSSLDPDHVNAIRLWVKRQHRQSSQQDLTDEELDHLFKYTKCENLETEWFDALDQIDIPTREYYLSVLRNGFKIGDDPKCHINTIHGVKGGEADNVVLRTDMTYRSHEAMSLNVDNEHRVFYVGATRARDNLYIVQPQTNRGYLM